jgi:hypothetical protein
MFNKGDLVGWKGDEYLFGIVVGMNEEDPRFVNVVWLVDDLSLQKDSTLADGLFIVGKGPNDDSATQSNA